MTSPHPGLQRLMDEAPYVRLLARQLLVYVPATEQVANIVSVVATWPESAGPTVAEELEAVVASLRLFTPR